VYIDNQQDGENIAAQENRSQDPLKGKKTKTLRAARPERKKSGQEKPSRPRRSE